MNACGQKRSSTHGKRGKFYRKTNAPQTQEYLKTKAIISFHTFVFSTVRVEHCLPCAETARSLIQHGDSYILIRLHSERHSPNVLQWFARDPRHQSRRWTTTLPTRHQNVVCSILISVILLRYVVYERMYVRAFSLRAFIKTLVENLMIFMAFNIKLFSFIFLCVTHGLGCNLSKQSKEPSCMY